MKKHDTASTHNPDSKPKRFQLLKNIGCIAIIYATFFLALYTIDLVFGTNYLEGGSYTVHLILMMFPLALMYLTYVNTIRTRQESRADKEAELERADMREEQREKRADEREALREERADARELRAQERHDALLAQMREDSQKAQERFESFMARMDERDRQRNRYPRRYR